MFVQCIASCFSGLIFANRYFKCVRRYADAFWCHENFMMRMLVLGILFSSGTSGAAAKNHFDTQNIGQSQTEVTHCPSTKWNKSLAADFPINSTDIFERRLRIIREHNKFASSATIKVSVDKFATNKQAALVKSSGSSSTDEKSS